MYSFVPYFVQGKTSEEHHLVAFFSRTFFILIVEEYPMISVYHVLFIDLPLDGHVGFLHLGAVTNTLFIICISLMINNMEHLFNCMSTLHAFNGQVSVQIFVHF